MDENDIPKLRFLSYFDICLLVWLNIVAVVLCTAYGELKDEIKWNANLMQRGNFIDVFLARHVSGTYAHHQEH